EAHLAADVADVVALLPVPVHVVQGQRGAAAQCEPPDPGVDLSLDLRHGPRPLGGRLEEPLLDEAGPAQGPAPPAHPPPPRPRTHARAKQCLAASSSRSKRSGGCGRSTSSAPVTAFQCMTWTCKRPVQTTWYSSSSISRSTLRTTQACRRSGSAVGPPRLPP